MCLTGLCACWELHSPGTGSSKSFSFPIAICKFVDFTWTWLLHSVLRWGTLGVFSCISLLVVLYSHYFDFLGTYTPNSSTHYLSLLILYKTLGSSVGEYTLDICPGHHRVGFTLQHIMHHTKKLCMFVFNILEIFPKLTLKHRHRDFPLCLCCSSCFDCYNSRFTC